MSPPPGGTLRDIGNPVGALMLAQPSNRQAATNTAINANRIDVLLRMNLYSLTVRPGRFRVI
jgi:hypothetical protein